MTPIDLSKMLWDLANSITAFAAVQGVVFSYACAKKETGDTLNRKRLKLAISVMLVFIAAGECGAIEWCRQKLCGLDSIHCQLQTEAAIGRMFCVVGVTLFSIIILYARQLFSRQPFSG